MIIASAPRPIAYLLTHRLIADEGATTASTVTYLPIVAVVLGILILMAPLTRTSWSGQRHGSAEKALAEGCRWQEGHRRAAPDG